jgi:polyhydroxyalkanoate synthesis repressor PhaR
VRTIKKYPNRRLYDTAESRYITLHDIRQLVLSDEPFEVIDKKNGANITRTILLQVIAEQEQHGPSVMSRDFLAQIIRAYGGSVPQKVSGFLEESLTVFLEQQRALGESVRAGVSGASRATATDSNRDS